MVLSAYITRTVRHIKVLVNSRFDQALEEISDLKNERDLKAARDDQAGQGTPAPGPVP